MNIPTRVQASRQHPEPPSTKRVCRPSKYANDYKIELAGGPISGRVINKKTGYVSEFIYGTRELHNLAVGMFHLQMNELIASNPSYYDDLFNYEHISCFCPPHLPCHCDAIIVHLKRRAV